MVSFPEGLWPRAPSPFPLSLLGLSPPTTSPLCTLSPFPSSSLCPPSPPFSPDSHLRLSRAGRQVRRKMSRGYRAGTMPQGQNLKGPQGWRPLCWVRLDDALLQVERPRRGLSGGGNGGSKGWEAAKSRLERKTVTHQDFQGSEL